MTASCVVTASSVSCLRLCKEIKSCSSKCGPTRGGGGRGSGELGWHFAFEFHTVHHVVLLLISINAVLPTWLVLWWWLCYGQSVGAVAQGVQPFGSLLPATA